MIETKQNRDTVCGRLRREGRQVSVNLNNAFAEMSSLERRIADNQSAIGNARAQINRLRSERRNIEQNQAVLGQITEQRRPHGCP